MAEPITFAIVAAVVATELILSDRNARLNEIIIGWIVWLIFRNSQQSKEVAARAYFVAKGAILLVCLLAIVGALIYYFGG